jgi:hypothetical protein
MNANPADAGFVLCVDCRGYDASLIVRRLYRTIPDADAAANGLVRVVDESGEDYLYPQAMFVALSLPAGVIERLAS